MKIYLLFLLPIFLLTSCASDTLKLVEDSPDTPTELGVYDKLKQATEIAELLKKNGITVAGVYAKMDAGIYVSKENYPEAYRLLYSKEFFKKRLGIDSSIDVEKNLNDKDYLKRVDKDGDIQVSFRREVYERIDSPNKELAEHIHGDMVQMEVLFERSIPFKTKYRVKYYTIKVPRKEKLDAIYIIKDNKKSMGQQELPDIQVIDDSVEKGGDE